MSDTSQTSPTIVLDSVSRWYGEVLGINKVSVDIQAGITGLVGPNGCGKSTLMNLVCGLIRPGQGQMRVLGQRPWDNPALRRRVGYCPQFDHFYENFTGYLFLFSMLRLHQRGRQWAEESARHALEQAGLARDMNRKIRSYSKGMRQRIKIALALAHQPEILVLDEPFNGLDPVGRHEFMSLFAEYAREGRTVVVSSHILHEVERMTDRILMMSNGYILAEGGVREVRDLLRRHPFHVLIRTDKPRRLGALLLEEDGVSSVEIENEEALMLTTRDPDNLYLRLNALVLEHNIRVDLVTLSDENVQSIYQYLSGKEHH
ncbi:ABC transporter ATP-binding protein [bacterium]|nr:ABC transporter ATP-binding protein [bacterium]